MKRTRPALRSRAFSLIEMLVAISLMAIPLLAVGVLLAGGLDSFQETYNSVHGDLREDILVVTTAFGNVGRRSNRSNYTVYQINSGRFTPALPAANETLAVGQAVEFRGWDEPFDPANANSNRLESENTGTHYALFYLEGDELKVDYGAVDGAAGAVRGTSRNTSGIVTQTLARNVDVSGGTDIFSHTVIGGHGTGSVRLDLKLKDDSGRTAEIKTATLLRILWPQ